MKRLREGFESVSLARKIMALVLIAGILPLLGIALIASYEFKQSNVERLIFSANNGYEQALQSISDKLLRVQNVSTMISVNDTINETFAHSTDRSRRLIDFEEISAYTNTVEMSYGDISIYYYISSEFLVTHENSRRFRPVDSVWDTTWAKETAANCGRPTWTLFENSGRKSGEKPSLALVRYLWDGRDYDISVGMMVLTLEEQRISDSMIESLPGQSFYIEALDGQILASSGETDLRLSGTQRKRSSSGFWRTTLDGADYYARSAEISGLYFVSLFPKDVLSKQADTAFFQILGMFMLSFILILSIMLPVARSMLKRIYLLRDQMKAGGSNAIKKLNMKPQRDEIGMLISSYNDLVDRLDCMLEEKYILGQQKNSAEMKALQSQMNPHFLYNTMDMVNWMAQRGETDHIREVVYAISKFYRLTLSQGKDIITLGDELQLCQAYMDIQTRRFKNRIAYALDVEPELLSALLPKITLQPFIENAILHGIEQKQSQSGSITLMGFTDDEEGEYMILSVLDDGVGMNPEDKRKAHTNGSHYGMKNIEMRLSLFYGEPIEIKAESQENMGTCISIRIPVRINTCLEDDNEQ